MFADWPFGHSFGLVFGICMLVMGVVMVLENHPKVSYLKIDSDGFQYRSLYRGLKSYTWEDIDSIGLWKPHLSNSTDIEFLAFSLKGKETRRALDGYTNIIKDSFEKTPLEIVEMLTKYKESAQGG